MVEKKYRMLAAVAVLLAACVAKAEHPTLDQVQQIDAVLGQWNKNESPGSTIGIVIEGYILYERMFH